MKRPITRSIKRGIKSGITSGTVPTGHTVSNQSFDYGALSNDQAGAYTVAPNSGTITSIAIDSGDSGGDYETSGATIRTAVGSSVPSAVLSCTATFSDATTDTFTATITSVANTFSVADIDEFTTVTNGALTYGQTIQMRNGVYNDAEADKRIKRSGSAISGTITNLITVKPDTGATSTIRFIRIDNGSGGGGDGFRFENIVFERATDAGASPCVALQFGIDTIEFEECTFGVAAGTTGDNSSGLHFTNNGNDLTNVLVNNCLFENLYDGINSPGSNFTVTNNTFKDIYNDGIHQSGDAAITPHNVVIENNLIYNKKYAGAGAHGDFIQFNWSTAVTGPVNGLIIRNNKTFRGAGSSGDTDGQGIFIPGLLSGFIVGAIIENNFYFGTFVNGILVNDLQNSRIVGNTALWDIDADDGAGVGTTIIDTGNGDGNLIADNVANGYDDVGSTSSTTTNNATISNNTTAYAAVFDSPQYDADLTPANLYASYSNKTGGSTANAVPEQGGIVYTVIGGQNGSGAVDHPRSQTVSGLSFSDVTDATLSTLYDTAAVQLTSIGANGALVTLSGDDSPEFRIRNAADDADIVGWGTADAIIDNNERLELRETSSASNSTAINSTALVGETSDTWTITTEAAAGYTQNVLYFTGTNFGANLLRASAFSTVSDSKEFLISAWLNFDGAGTHYIFNFAGANALMVRVGTVVRMQLKNSSGTTIYERDITVGSGAVGETHILASGDLAAGTDHVYVNGTVDGGSATTLTNDTIDWTGINNTIGARPSSFDRHKGDLADLIVDNIYLDVSNSTNRGRFIDGSGDPVDPGSDGSTAVGSQPFYALIGQDAATIEAGAAGVGNVGYGGDVPTQASYTAGDIQDGAF